MNDKKKKKHKRTFIASNQNFSTLLFNVKLEGENSKIIKIKIIKRNSKN